MFKTLVVEDNRVFRQALTEMLHEQFPSMILDAAADSKEALLKIQDHPPNLIFMDISLPGENGLELTRRVMQDFPNTIVIIITNYDLPEYREAAHRYGARHFLSKSASSIDDIAGLIRSFL